MNEVAKSGHSSLLQRMNVDQQKAARQKPGEIPVSLPAAIVDLTNIRQRYGCLD